jgi:hypothetical protein
MRHSIHMLPLSRCGMLARFPHPAQDMEMMYSAIQQRHGNKKGYSGSENHPPDDRSIRDLAHAEYTNG